MKDKYTFTDLQNLEKVVTEKKNALMFAMFEYTQLNDLFQMLKKSKFVRYNNTQICTEESFISSPRYRTGVVFEANPSFAYVFENGEKKKVTKGELLNLVKNAKHEMQQKNREFDSARYELELAKAQFPNYKESNVLARKYAELESAKQTVAFLEKEIESLENRKKPWWV